MTATYPVDPATGYSDVPKSRWSPAIASLHPEAVTLHRWGVDIWIKPYFDGGWGYHLARERHRLPLLDGCYSDLGNGVYWHGPC